MKKLQITEDKVRETAERYPESKHVLSSLFPEVFEDDKPFILTGMLFKRKNYPDNVYSVQELNNKVRILNVTYCCWWDDRRSIPVDKLKTRLRSSRCRSLAITRGEFKQLANCNSAGNTDIDDFTIVGNVEQLNELAIYEREYASNH